ncbi:MAG: dockerin type I domain-containing protein [Isosphaeraceae bacterium]
MLVGSGDQSLSGTGTLTNLEIAKPSGKVLMSGFNKTFTQIRVSAGSWDVLGNAVSATSGFNATGSTILGTGNLTGSVTLGSGGVLAGGLVVNGSVTANSGGAISPGAPIGTLTVNGNLTMNAGSTLLADISGATSDQVIVNGAVNILGATLGGTSSSPTGSYTVIVNDASDGIAGSRFAGASNNGDSILITATFFQLTYVGGTGNDLVLTAPATVQTGVVDVVDITPDPRKTDVSSIDFTFSAPIDLNTLSASDVVLTRDGVAVPLSGLGFSLVSGNTYRVTGLGSATSASGSYRFTVNGSGINDAGGSAVVGSAFDEWLNDQTAPTSKVDALATRQAATSFVVSVTGSDTSPGSGVASYDIYARIDTGAWAFWTNVPASDPKATYAGTSNTTYAFYSVGRDAVGNVEAKSPIVEASTFVPDLVLPETGVTAVDSTSSLLKIDWTGTDTGGSGLRYFDLYVVVDGSGAQLVGRFNAGTASGGIYSGSTTYTAPTDGVLHSYRFYTIGIDGNGNTEAAPLSPQDVSLTASFAVPASAAVEAITVQKGARQRSFIRYVDIVLNRAGSVTDLVNSVNDNDTSNDRVRLTRYDLNGAGTPATVALKGLTAASGRSIAIDFGASGLGGAPNTTTADGYYQFDFDLDGDGTFETARNFYRLLGDVNGDRAVDVTDINLISVALGQSGSNLETDLNGDGVVNSADRTLAIKSNGRRLLATLRLDG